ncbi:MAG: hypothetical protein U1A24_10615 [Cypionkella sp.]|uniref:AIM24 family protein n=1 Tax=Cypionkella sp. TaxID=2811411 RepID=UPI002ABB010D|nr:AIM24 family protein [Cypionkella sp.]MDZ4310991.1 hypothetical protein [Cypionkella sp.]
MSASWPGLGSDWFVITNWSQQIPVYWIILPPCLIALVLACLTIFHRDLRYVPAAFAPAVLAAMSHGQITSHAPLLTETPLGVEAVDGAAVGLSPDRAMTLGGLIAALVAPQSLPLGGALLPPPVALEVQQIRAYQVAAELQTILNQRGDLPVGAIVAPTPPAEDLGKLRSDLSIAEGKLAEAQSEPRIFCNPEYDKPGDLRNEECHIREQLEHEILQGAIKAVELAKQAVALAEVKASTHADDLATYQVQSRLIAEAAGVLSYQRGAAAEASRVTRMRLVALAAAALILASALLTPGLSAVPIVVAPVLLLDIGDLRSNLPFTSAHFAVFLISFVVCRLINLAARGNWPLLRLPRPAERKAAFLQTAVRSWPIAVTLVALLILSAWIDSQLQGWIYRIPIDSAIPHAEGPEGCHSGGTLIFQQPDVEGCAPQRLKTDVLASSRWHLNLMEQRMLQAVDQARAEGITNADAYGAKVLEIFERHVPKRLAKEEVKGEPEALYVSADFDFKRCRWYSVTTWGNCIGNMLKAPARKGYASLYNDARANLQLRITAAMAKAKDNLDQLHEAMRQEISASMAELQRTTDAEIRRGFRARDLLSSLARIALLVSLLSAVTHVFLRTLCSLDGLEARLMRHAPSSGRRPGSESSVFAEEQIRVTEGSTFQMPAGKTLRIRREHPPVNLQGNWAAPRLISAPRGRFVKYVVPQNAERVSLSFSQARRVVAIDLRQGQRLAFHPSSLLGYEEGVRFRTLLRRRAFDILCGRFRTVTALGPGKIFLLLDGDLLVLPTKDSGGVVHVLARQIIAWSPDAQFTLRRDVTLWALYFNHPLVAPVPGGLALVDQARRARGGGARPIGILAALLAQV